MSIFACALCSNAIYDSNILFFLLAECPSVQAYLGSLNAVDILHLQEGRQIESPDITRVDWKNESHPAATMTAVTKFNVMLCVAITRKGRGKEETQNLFFQTSGFNWTVGFLSGVVVLLLYEPFFFCQLY